jgi:hypothetical protein
MHPKQEMKHQCSKTIAVLLVLLHIDALLRANTAYMYADMLGNRHSSWKLIHFINTSAWTESACPVTFSAQPCPAARQLRGGEEGTCAEVGTSVPRRAPCCTCSCALLPPRRPPQTPTRQPPPAGQTAQQQISALSDVYPQERQHSQFLLEPLIAMNAGIVLEELSWTASVARCTCTSIPALYVVNRRAL